MPFWPLIYSRPRKRAASDALPIPSRSSKKETGDGVSTRARPEAVATQRPPVRSAAT